MSESSTDAAPNAAATATATATPSSATPSPNHPPPRRQRLILGVLIFAQLLIWLDGTILTTAFETLADPVRGLGATPGQLQWSTGAYTLVFATLMFTGGALGDRFGHRDMLVAGMALFGAASAAAAYVTAPSQLIAARAVMGASAALLVPATMAVVSWTFEPARRPAAYGTLSSFAGVGIAAGPILAGVLLAHFWWGSVFLVNVPVVIVGIVFIGRTVPNFRSPQVRRLDPAGMVLSTAGLGLLAYGLIRAGQDASFGGAAVWGTVVSGLVLLAVFVIVELRMDAPSFDPRLLTQRRFASGNITLMFIFLAMMSAGFFGAFYLQGARRYSAIDAAFYGLPAAAGVLFGAPIAVKLVRRTSVRLVATTALLAAALSMGAWSLFGLSTPIGWYLALNLMQGLSIGMVIAPITGAVLGALPMERAGAGSAVNSALRQTGSVLGIAVGGMVMSIVYRRAVDGSLAGLPAQVRAQARVSAELARHVGVVKPANDAFIHAMHVGAFWSAGFVLVGALVLVLGFRPDRRVVIGGNDAVQPERQTQPHHQQQQQPEAIAAS